MDQSNQNWFSSVEAPIKVSSRDAVSWDESKDLVVVGFGGADQGVVVLRSSTTASRADGEGSVVVDGDGAV